jgi:uncharacterized protein (UPF0548 family)
MDNAQLSLLLNQQSRMNVTYSPVGITEQEHPIQGYHFVHDAIELGGGRETFERAVHCIQEWRVHEGVGLRVTANSPFVEQGSTAVFQMRIVGLNVTLACRVVKIMIDDNRWGFAYGTLPHHVERGEELFLVEQLHDGSVQFKVVAHSRSGHLMVRAGAPVARVVQRGITTRYLRAMKELVVSAS